MLPLVSSDPADQVVPVPQTAWEIMDAKLNSLVFVTAQTDRRLDAMEVRREDDAKRIRQLDSISGRLSQAVMRFQLWQVASRAVPAVTVLIALAAGSFLATASVILALHAIDASHTGPGRAFSGSASISVPADGP